MGSSKKITVSYWYKLIMHLGWCKGPIDALLEIRGGDRPAWIGRKETSGDIYIDRPNLYGGESAEGGIQGTFEVLMGEADQMPSAYLASEFGDAQPGYRGRATVLLKGPKIGAGNPYPKPLYFKLLRIFKGWDDDVCWYPEKAQVVITPDEVFINDLSFNAQNASIDGSYAGVTINSGFTAQDVLIVEKVAGMTYRAWSPWSSDSNPLAEGRPWTNRFVVTNDQGQDTHYWWDQDDPDYRLHYYFPTQAEAEAWTLGKYVYLTGSSSYTFWLYDTPVNDNRGGASFRVYKNGVFAMNPAHILYDSITSRRENGGMEEPVARINLASFQAAADRLYDEGFGLCCTWHGGESAEQFQQRICNVIGASLSQSRTDGQYYIDLLRSVADPSALPTITDDDIVDWNCEPAVPSESINQIQVKWFDPTTRKERITPPVQALGAIEDAGGIFADIREYYEIPSETLALRVAQRDLQSLSTALWKFTFTATRRPFDLRPGMQVRLMCPKRGFADIIVVIGDIDYGDFGNDQIDIVALQDVFSLPDAAFVNPQEGLGPPANAFPVNVTESVITESPYVELVSTLPAGELNALTDDAGYVMVGARRPSNGNNYALATKASGESYGDQSIGDWTPSARIVEAENLTDALPQTSFTFTAGSLLGSVEVGTWALWGEEICKVEALNVGAGTITLGRACADTVPAKHPAGSIIYFIGDWYATDSREYVDGEVVSAKVMNRTGQAQIDIAAAPEVSIEMNSRQARPYPPARVRINGLPYPSEVVGAVEVTWQHRDRVLQADQLIDTEQSSIGPEPGTTYTVEFFNVSDDTLEHSESGIAGTAITPWAPSGGGLFRMEAFSVRDTLESYQRVVHEFLNGDAPWTPEWMHKKPLLLVDDRSTFTEVSGAVSQWSDRSGWGNHLAQSSSGARPVRQLASLGGRDTVRFDGSNDNLNKTSPQNALVGVQAGWSFKVYKKRSADVSATARCVFLIPAGSTGSRLHFAAGSVVTANTPRLWARRLDGDTTNGVDAPAAPIDTWMLLGGSMDYATGQGVLKYNGVDGTPATLTTLGSTSATNPSFLSVGATNNTGTEASDVDLAALIVGGGSSLPSTDEWDRITAHYAWRYGLKGLLDALHPYKTEQPKLPSGADLLWPYVDVQCEFEGANGATVFTEETGKVMTRFGNAVLSNAVAPPYGTTALLLDGTGDYASMPFPDRASPGSHSGRWAVFATIRLGVNNKLQCICSRRPSTTPTEWTFAVTVAGKLGFYAWNPNLIVNLEGATTLAANTWYKVSAQRDIDGTWRLYVDELEDASVVQSGAPSVSTGTPLLIGREGSNTARDFNGRIKGLRIASDFGVPVPVPHNTADWWVPPW